MLASSTTSSGSSKNSTVVRSDTQLRLARMGIAAAFAVTPELGAAALVRLFTTPRRFARPPREAPVIARAERFTVRAPLSSPRWDGASADVAAWRWGVGPTVLLVHGWEGRGSQLGALVEPLVDAGLSVVTFDAPGHGDSPGHRLYLADLADVIAAVAAQVGPLQAVVAHSFGAMATLVAHAHDALAGARLVLLAPNALVDQSIEQFAKAMQLSPAERAHFEARLVADTGTTLAELAMAALAPADSDAPAMLVIHDQDDREVTIDGAEAVAAAWPGATLRRTTGLGHRRILRDAAVLADVAAFAAVGVEARPDELRRAMGTAWADGLDLSGWTS